MDAIVYRSLQTSDAEAVFAVAREAWQFTYAAIFDPAFIDQFVRTNYAPERLRALVPLVEAKQMFFDVALDADRIMGFCNIGMTARGAELFRIYLRPAYIGRGSGSTLLERGEGFVRTRGFQAYYCFVHKDNELGKRFYLRHGFHHCPESDQHDEWYMEKQLTRTITR
jgi:ribosomal protein S18 acetylase RimI-like enzyme